MSFLDATFVNETLEEIFDGDCARLLYDLGELPDKLLVGKDVDILIHDKDFPYLSSKLKKLNFHEVTHPNIADTYIYGALKRRMFLRKGLFLDIHSQIVVRSLDAGQWMPLDVTIQEAAWATKALTESEFPIVPREVECIYLIARCIFDKKCFPKAQRERISYLLCNQLESSHKNMTKKVFFSFSEILLDFARRGDFDSIFKAYKNFRDY